MTLNEAKKAAPKGKYVSKLKATEVKDRTRYVRDYTMGGRICYLAPYAKNRFMKRTCSISEWNEFVKDAKFYSIY